MYINQTLCFGLLFFILFFGNKNIYAQVNNFESKALVQEFNTIASKQLSEAVYLQTSKNIYETGEDLWFKAYVLNSQYFIPSDLSKTIFIRLVEDKSNTPIWQEKYSIEYGFVDGHIYVQDTLKTGNYRLEAFTPHSFSSKEKEFKTFKRLNIVTSISELQKDPSTTKPLEIVKTDSLYFHVFPEGGHLVSEIQSIVGFKAVDFKGLPVNVSGTLYENDNPLINFKTSHAGMGGFMLTPDINKTYHIVVKDSLSSNKFKLPPIKNKGKVLQLMSNLEDVLIFKITQSEDFEKETIYLRLQIRGVVYGMAKVELDKEIIVKIPLENTPQGIAEVTLFDENFQAIAERLVYINPDQKLTINTTLDKDQYRTKEEAKLKVKVIDQNGDPVVAHLGLTIYDQIYNNPEDSKTIESHFQLSNVLKGNLYNPRYYFNEENKDRIYALNLLMLTQGWRAYEWNETNLKENALVKQVKINDTVLGNIFGKTKKSIAALSQQNIMTFTAEENSPKNLIEVDSMGNFTILPENIQYAKNAYIYLKLLLNDPGMKMTIKVNDSTFSKINELQKTKNMNYPSLRVEKKAEKIISPFLLANELNQLKEVMVSAKKKQLYRDKYMGSLDSLLQLEANNDYVCLYNILNCKNHEVDPENRRPIVGESYYLLPYAIGFPGRLTQYTGQTSSQKCGYTDEELLKRFNVARIKGYYPKKVFYEPVYNSEEQLDSFPDYRNTLYWKPDIITDENGEATVSFFCSDINTRFLGNIEGASSEGLLGSSSFELIVLKRK